MKKKVFLAVCNLLKAKFLRKRIPLVVGWSVTNRCNLKCLYCTSWKSKIDELDTKQIFSIINELSNMGTYSINFTGGEPLIRDDIGKIIEYTKSKGINTGITSNGLLVPQRVGEIKNSDSFTLSFDGGQQEHDAQRCNGSYLQVLRAIKIAKENNIYVKLHTVLTKNNIESIDFILGFAKECDLIVNFSIVEFGPFSEEENIRELLPSEEKFKLAIHRLIVKKKNGDKNIGNSLGGLIYFYHWPYYKKINCSAGMIHCRIESNGDVYPCANLIYKVKPQNCISQGFKNAFTNLQQTSCRFCWCDTRIEMNYVYALRLKAIQNIKINHRL